MQKYASCCRADVTKNLNFQPPIHFVVFLQFYHEEGCIYHGNEIGYFPTLASISLCQLACANTPQCVYFLDDFDIKDCQLFDSGKRDCDFLVGPANPTYEECKEDISTTTTTADTTTKATTTTVTTTTTATTVTTTTSTTTTVTTTTPSIIFESSCLEV